MESLPPQNFKKVLQRLQKDAASLPLSERRAVAQQLSAALQKADSQENLIPLVQLLAVDPRPEVRTDIAELLVWLPEDDFLRLTAQLSKDNNAYVCRAAERALDRRRKGKHEAERRQRGLDVIRAEYEDMENLHGRVAAEKARVMADRLYDVLVGSTVHNMRGILAPAKLNAATLAKRIKEGQSDPASALKALEKMVERLSLLERMMSNMRAYSRLPSTKRRSERLVRLVQEAVAMAREALNADGKLKSNIEIEIAINEDITIVAAKDAIVMALYNLLRNSYEAFPVDLLKLKSGSIVLRAEVDEDGMIRLTIADNGMGMDAEELEAVRQLNPGQVTLKRDGTGFGLPIANRYVVEHGGRLEIQSVENQGTTVTISFPRDSAEDEA